VHIRVPEITVDQKRGFPSIERKCRSQVLRNKAAPASFAHRSDEDYGVLSLVLLNDLGSQFAEYLDRYHRNQLFLGIRYGNIWGYSLVNQVTNPVFIEGLNLLQQADLVLDTANPNPDLIQAVIRVTDLVPGLRVVIDHVPAMLRQLDANGRAAIDPNMRELAKRPQVYIKVSSVMIVAGGQPVTDPAVYKPNLDYLFQTFGEDRLIFGSDWPNSVAADNLTTIVKIVQDYFYAKGSAVAEKYFWRNSLAAYKWVRRESAQPTP